MKTPLEILQDTLIIPVHDFQHKYLSKHTAHKVCKKAANFIFNCSKETALVMLGFNALSIISSHLAQIRGLKKSNRENKDYLITQEKHELGLDLLLTIIPPFMLNNFLKKKLESGELTTKEARDKLINVVAPVVGASRDELYSTKHIRPLKETLGNLITKPLTALLQSDRNLPLGMSIRLRRINNAIKKKLPDPVTTMYPQSIEQMNADFDNQALLGRISEKILSKFRNKSATDDVGGFMNGFLILATIGYTILASNVIMPIITNKLANRTYEKQLKAMGETRESIKRKKRFAFNDVPPLETTNSSIFDTFTINNSIQAKPSGKYKSPFAGLNSTTPSQSSGLRI